jgi:prefoldin subunit 5
VTRQERTDLAAELNAIQATIDALLDQIVNVNEPKRKSAPAKIKTKKGK